jgi:hypothetical protein
LARWHNRVSSDRCHEILEGGEWSSADVFPGSYVGASIIMHQDFAHWYTAWIHPIHYRLREYLEPLYDIPASGKHGIRLTLPSVCSGDRAMLHDSLQQTY